MGKEEKKEYLEPKCTQLMRLRESLHGLRDRRDLSKAIKEANLRAAETSNQPEEAERIQRRYLQGLSKIETAIRRTEMQIEAFERENPCRAAEGKEARE
ncbi:MAG: hypothetical protein CVU64_09415 [Deltaproteobacteria bacterium HGW-Deltaproteobacteria-21]|nr:MAG: hypothetical protein CVU64_09415 [Deltaproteobacteria bacterium HGW-Deltaproteobacteria-21]